MDQLDQDLTRFKNPAMALVGGIAAALVVATLPSVYLEKIIGMTGLAEIVSAAAPPLGNTAKSLLAVFAGLFSTSVIFYFLHRKGDADMGLAIRKLANWEEEKAEWEEQKAKPKKGKFSLKRLLQKPKKKKNEVKDLSDLPNLREKDTHPDAPARQPIFADKDLGAPLETKIKPFDQPDADLEAAEAVQVDSTPEVAPAPFVMDKSLQSPEPLQPTQEMPLDLSGRISAPPAAAEAQSAAPTVDVNPAMVVEPDAQVATASPTAPEPISTVETIPAPLTAPQPEMVEQPKEDLSGLSILQLTERLEAGLDKLGQLQQFALQPASPSVSTPTTVATAPVGMTVSSSEAAPSAPPALKSVEPTQEEVEAKRQADMDAALKAALGTLEKMTAQR